MKDFKIYRTAKGTLTFKEYGDSVYTVRANSTEIAKQVLAHLKQMEKNKK